MSSQEPGRITELLKAWAAGNPAAEQQLIPLVYRELRHLASRARQRLSVGETLETTALVHEAYLRLVGIEGLEWRDRVHFFAVSAQLMRRILIDAARAQQAAKRGGTEVRGQVPLDWEQIQGSDSDPADVLAVDQALTRLAELDARRARIVELRIFGGLSAEETAEVLSVSAVTVLRDWKVAKAWLMKTLEGPGRSVVAGAKSSGSDR